MKDNTENLNNKTKKPKKFFKLFLLLLFILGVWYFFIYEPKMYMYGNPYLGGWDKRKVEIPKEIVKAKDCEAFKKFADEKMGPDFIFSAGCPWAKIEPIGHFILNGIIFNVPRTYLWQGGRASDGLSKGLYAMMRYPKLDPSNGDNDLDIEVSVTPKIKEKYFFYNKIWVDSSQGWYLSTSGVEYKLDEFLRGENLSKYIVDAPEMEMKGYINKYGDVRTYFTGDLLNPDYWIDCAPAISEDGRCESSFMYKGNNFVSYSFRRKGLVEHHKEIRNKIKEKLDEFTHIGDKNG